MSLAKSQMKPSRNSRGNLLIFTSVLMSVMAFGAVIAMSFTGLYFSQNRLQSSANEIALAGARKINEYNRLGQMNDMVARSPQLLFSSRQAEQNVGAADLLLDKLALQLTDEARNSAHMLESERQNLSMIAQAEAVAEMQNKFNEIKNSYEMNLPWLRVSAPNLVLKNTGTIADMPSNSHGLEGFSDLVQSDISQNHVSKGQVKLYKAEANLNLANTKDSDIPFNFSPLPAPVVNDMAPARNVLAEKFRKSVPGYGPCATLVEMDLNVETGLGAPSHGVIKTNSVAVATGGGLWQ